MSFLLRHISRYAVQKLTSDPMVKDKAAKVAREKDKARAAGQALRRTMNKLQGD